MAAGKKLNDGCVGRVYKQAYKEKFNWDNVLPDTMFQYLDPLAKARPCPISPAMGSLLPISLAFWALEPVFV